jgi:integrase
MRRKGLLHTKTVTIRGRAYVYFKTGRKDAKGKAILVRLPQPGTPQFGATYAGLLAAMHRTPTEADITVGQLIDKYEDSPKFKTRAEGTKRIYRIYLDQFRAMLPTAPAGELERKDMAVLLDKKAATPSAANSLLKIVSALYAWGRERGLVENDPCKDIALHEGGEHEKWPDAAVALGLTADDRRIRLAVHLLLYTAQRIGDVCALRWSNIEGDAICLTQQKTGRYLEIPIHKKLRAELATHERTLGTIMAMGGKPATPAALRRYIQIFASERGHVIVPHGLRKNAVNALLEAGCSVAETAAISGQSLKLVEHYAKGRSQAKLGRAAIARWENQS